MAETQLQGSCLCGAVAYEIRGDAQRFYHCHCQRCRKASGTGHATNLLVTPANSLRWIRGEEHLKRYKVPEAERFTNQFCGQCGSPMPRAVADKDFVVVPAGTLEQEPPIQPSARIFWDSRAHWSCCDDLPVFPEYP